MPQSLMPLRAWPVTVARRTDTLSAFRSIPSPAWPVTTFELAGKLRDAAGIAVGQFSKFAKREEAQPSLEEVLADHLGRVRAPSFTGLCVGHGKWNHPVPVGVKATVDADKPSLTITESALD